MSKTIPKPKIKLGKKPETFPAITVEFVANDGTQSDIKATFRYRTRKEFGAFVSEHFAPGADAEFPRTEDGGIDFEALAEKGTGNDAAYLAGCLTSWDLEDELTAKSLQQLSDEQPAAVAALKAAYAAACNEGRLGN